MSFVEPAGHSLLLPLSDLQCVRGRELRDQGPGAEQRRVRGLHVLLQEQPKLRGRRHHIQGGGGRGPAALSSVRPRAGLLPTGRPAYKGLAAW